MVGIEVQRVFSRRRVSKLYSLVLFLGTPWLLWSGPVSTVEMAALSTQTWEAFAPMGKEMDAIFGDFVLRNGQLVAVIANPVRGRHANVTTHNVGGSIIDLTRRRQQSDLLNTYSPVADQFSLRFAGVSTRAPSVYQVHDLGQLFVRADEISLDLIGVRGNKGDGHPDVTVRYRLAKGWPYVLVETVYFNSTDRPVDFRLADAIRVDQSGDGLTPELVPDGKMPLFWVYDKWFGQAYGLISENGDLYSGARGTGRTPKTLTYLPGGQEQASLQPGETLEIRRRIFPGSDLLEIRAIASELRKLEQESVDILVQDRRGSAIGQADVLLSRDGEPYAWGRTGLDGVLKFRIPQGTFEAKVSALGYGSTSLDLELSRKTSYVAALDTAGFVVAEIKDEQGNFIPAKLQFRGREGTSDPFFGPNSGEHAVHNLYYTHDGRVRQVLPPGSYEVIVSRGPEYDAVFSEVAVRRGQESHLPVTLVRSVRTPGWISSDFHSHSSPSGDNTSSQLGRVLNLLGNTSNSHPARSTIESRPTTITWSSSRLKVPWPAAAGLN